MNSLANPTDLPLEIPTRMFGSYSHTTCYDVLRNDVFVLLNEINAAGIWMMFDVVRRPSGELVVVVDAASSEFHGQDLRAAIMHYLEALTADELGSDRMRLARDIIVGRSSDELEKTYGKEKVAKLFASPKDPFTAGYIEAKEKELKALQLKDAEYVHELDSLVRANLEDQEANDVIEQHTKVLADIMAVKEDILAVQLGASAEDRLAAR